MTPTQPGSLQGLALFGAAELSFQELKALRTRVAGDKLSRRFSRVARKAAAPFLNAGGGGGSGGGATLRAAWI